MLYSGIVSVTFRGLQPADVVKLTAEAGLDAVEWGGDVHVPHGDTKKAREVYALTIDSGLKIASYGSYYTAGVSPEKGLSFDSVLESALELHAPNIRVWAGATGSREADDDCRKRVTEDTQRICEAALKENIGISFEYHANSLTDTPESALKLIRDVNCSNVYTYWQPSLGISFEERLKALEMVSPWLTNIHAYQWKELERMPLASGKAEWNKYFELAAKIKGDRYCLLEFVKDDKPEQFIEDAASLKEFLQSYNVK